MKWLLRGVALCVLLLMAACYLTVAALALCSDCASWVMNAADRQLEKLVAWGDAL